MYCSDLHRRPDEYVFAGTGLTVTFDAAGSGDEHAGPSVDEGKYMNGQWGGRAAAKW